jgi:hypothetical protein
LNFWVLNTVGLYPEGEKISFTFEHHGRNFAEPFLNSDYGSGNIIVRD